MAAEEFFTEEQKLQQNAHALRDRNTELELQVRLLENSNLALRLKLRKVETLSRRRYQRLKAATDEQQEDKQALAQAWIALNSVNRTIDKQRDENGLWWIDETDRGGFDQLHIVETMKVVNERVR